MLRRKKRGADLGRSSETQLPNTVEDIPLGSNLAYGEIKQPFSASTQQEKLTDISQDVAYATILPKEPTATSESVYEVPDPAQQNYYAPVGGNRASLSAPAQQKIDFSENVAYGAKLSDVSSDALYEDPDCVIP